MSKMSNLSVEWEELQEKQQALYARLDNLEGCEDNATYAGEIKEIRQELSRIQDRMAEIANLM